MQEQLIEQGTLQLDDIHHHWYLATPLPHVMEPLVLEPARENLGKRVQLFKIQSRCSNRASRARTSTPPTGTATSQAHPAIRRTRAATSTQRNLSKFEVVLKSQRQLRKRQN
jgi:hypothetical protein